jgi:hypothetical protein
MGLCYFCETATVDSWFSTSLCEDCKKLQLLIKTIGVNKLVTNIRVKVKDLNQMTT